METPQARVAPAVWLARAIEILAGKMGECSLRCSIVREFDCA